MKRRLIEAVLVALLAGCGGGGAGTPDLGAVVTVEYGDTGGFAGLTYLDDGPVRIVLATWLRDFPNAEYRQHTLRHELWHAATRIHGHPTDPMCVSADDRSPYAGPLDRPCPVEREQMRASDPIRVRFAGHYAEAWDAATWWNYETGANIVEVVE